MFLFPLFYVIREFHRFLHRGKAQLMDYAYCMLKNSAMAIGVTVLGVLLVCFLDQASATYCSDDSDCYGYLESCCSDYVCRERCFYCSYDSQCGTGECCNSNGDCKTSCSSVTGGAIAVAGIIVSLVFVAIIASIAACFFCACCPWYRHRHPGAVVVGAPANQSFVTTTTTQATQQTIQHPPPAGYYQPPSGYNQPPPPYYPQPQAGPYPPNSQGQAPYPPPQAQGEAACPPPQAQAPYPQFPDSTGYPMKQ